jgi:hypothetical protein
VGKNQENMNSDLEWTASMHGKPERTASMQAKHGGGLLANLVSSLPPWISKRTFKRVLDDGDMKSLVSKV